MLRAKGFDKVTPRLVEELEKELAANFESLGGKSLPIAKDMPELVNAYKGIWRHHRTQYGYTLLSELPYQAAGVLEDLDETDLGIDLLIVDEFQDLNNADQKVLQELARRGIAIIGIGDDDQSIYSWRNAAPEGIRNFQTTFGTEFDYPLSVSQRCGGLALEIANNLIEQDPNRPKKSRLSPSERAPETAFHYLRFKSNSGEAKGAAAIAASRIAAGVPANSIGVLVRSSIPAWAYELRKTFDDLGVPIAPPADVDVVLADSGVRAALAFAQLIRNRLDSLAWRAILEVAPGVGKTSVDYVYASATKGTFAERLFSLHEAGFPRLRRAALIMGLITTTCEKLGSIELAAVSPPEDGGWGAWLATQVGDDRFAPGALELFLAVGTAIGSEADFGRFINDFEPTARELVSGLGDGVRLITMGMSKGLTLDTTIIMGVENGNIPSPRGEDSEELRLLYVALTRATQLTVVTYANRRKGPTARVGDPRVWVQREQSPFMADMNGASLEDGDAFTKALAASALTTPLK